MKSIPGRHSTTAQTFTTMRLMGTQQYLTAPSYHPILREEVEAAVKALKMGKSAGVDNISAELIQAGRHPDLKLQQDLEDRRMTDHMDSNPSYHTPKERQLAAVPEVQNLQPYQPS